MATETSMFYVADLAAYNNGTLRGCYVTPSEFDNGEDMATALDAYILRNEVAPGIDPGIFAGPVRYDTEEYLVHDYTNGPITHFSSQLGETSQWVKLWELCNLLDNADNADALVAFMENQSMGLDDIDDATDRFQEAFCGEHDSERDYAYSLAEDTVEGFDEKVSSWPWSCIDWNHAWNELRIGGDNYSISNPDGGYWIFTSY